ncbi:MAG: GH1 family beta-glucosidase [Mycobacteriales bacterium]
MAGGFPDGFEFGVATAAYQIEGAVTEDGRGPSIWDTFTHTPGRVKTGETGDVACDHYHRWPEDIRLMADLGVTSYRFSLAWPRVQPAGSGPVNPKGLDFYSRLVDGLLEAGIAPAATLYHWDLPQPLEDAGGWLTRATAERFAEYAGIVAERLGDRVARWITLNEPFCSAIYGYAVGRHAPGRDLGLGALPAVHHLLLGHGLAVPVLRAASPGVPVGITLNLTPPYPVEDTDADAAAATRADAWINGMYLDPVLRGRYPGQGVDAAFDALGVVESGDLTTMAAPLDFLGVNYYAPIQVRDPAAGPASDDERLGALGAALGFGVVEYPPEVRRTGFDWPVVPEAFSDLLSGLRDRYGPDLPPIHITENGSAWPDTPGPDGRVDDPDRVAYLDSHLGAVRSALADGVDVRGYYVWSLIDNFEWAEGTSQRFGLVHVDYDTQRRTPKASYDYYRDFITTHRSGR